VNPAYGWSLFTAFCTFVLILAGGLVTSTDSGLSVPDWPMSYGSWFPPMVGGIRFEHSHRMIAGFVGLCVLVLVFVVHRCDERRWMRNLSLFALVGVALQALLGGLTVLYLLPLPVSVAHGCLGQILLATLAAIAFGESAAWRSAESASAIDSTLALRQIFLFLVGAVSFQLVLGAIVRHSSGGFIWWHIAGACAVAILSVASFWTVHKTAGHVQVIRVLAVVELMLVLIQISTGLSAYYMKIHVDQPLQAPLEAVLVATAHQTTGALIFVASVLLLLAAHRFLAPAKSSQ